MAKYCLYCGLQYSDDSNFCPSCGRPTEKGFRTRPDLKSELEAELERLQRELKEKDELIQRLMAARELKT